MKITNKSQALNIIEPAYLASLSSLLWIALYYLPVGGALLRLMLPLPISLLNLRRGTKAAFEGAASAGATGASGSSIFTGTLSGICVLTATLVAGLCGGSTADGARLGCN